MELMNRYFARACFLVGILSITYYLAGCDILRKTVRLPNDYRLEERGKRILLISPDNVVLCQNNITDFMVEKDTVYGWIDLDPHQYFFLDTRSGQFEVFVVRREFSSFIKRKGLPQFDMKFSYTFWDLTSGRRKLDD